MHAATTSAARSLQDHSTCWPSNGPTVCVLARAALKRRIAAGKLDTAEVVLSCPWEVESMAVSELIMSQRRWGRTRTRKFLDTIGLSENKTVG